jgi:hypothetical protein
MRREKRCSDLNRTGRSVVSSLGVAIFLWVCVFFSSPAPAEPSVQFVPLISPENGVVTRVELLNPLDEPVPVTVYGYSRKGGHSSLLGKPFELGKQESRVLETRQIPPLTGFLRIESSGSLIATAVLASEAGSKSEAIPATQISRKLDFVFFDGCETQSSILYLVNPSASAVQIELKGLGGAGQRLGTKKLSLGPAASSSVILKDIFGAAALKSMAALRVKASAPIGGFSLTRPAAGDFAGLPAQIDAADCWTFSAREKLGAVSVSATVAVFNPGTETALLTLASFDPLGKSLRSQDGIELPPGGTCLVSQKADGVFPFNAARLWVTADRPLKGAQVFKAGGGGIAGALGTPGCRPESLLTRLSGEEDGSVLKAQSMAPDGLQETEWIKIGLPGGVYSHQAATTSIISWTNTMGAGTYVRLWLLRGESVVTEIAGGLWINSSAFYWLIPYWVPESSDYRLLIRTDLGIEAFSETFSISDTSFDIVDPNGFENWQMGKTYTIRWNFAGDPGATVRIWLFKGDSNIMEIAGGVPIGDDYYHSGSYKWTIPTSLQPGNDYKILVRSARDIEKYSDHTFSLLPSGVEVTAPLGQVGWEKGSRQEIKWTYKTNAGKYLDVWLYKGGTGSRVLAERLPIGTAGKGSYNWIIPSDVPTGTDYSIYIETDKGLSDVSDGNFTITGTGVTVREPASLYRAASQASIWWSYLPYAGSNVRMDLFKGDGFYAEIAGGIPIGEGGQGAGQGLYQWIIPCLTTPGDDYTVRVKTDLGFEGFSPTFRIRGPEFRVTQPKHGTYKPGAQLVVGWTTLENIGKYVRLDLYQSDTYIMNIATGIPVDDELFRWIVDKSIPTGEYYRILARTNKGVGYWSGTFLITEP